MTTTTTTTPRSAARRLLSISAAAAIAAAGFVGLSAPAHAADANSRVWVCKYVGTPGEDERLSTGENPIEVSGNSVDKDKDGQVFVGDQFADAQGRSVIVQIGGEDPGVEACSPTPPPVPPTDPPVPPTDPPVPSERPTAPPTPGDGAPQTGGESGDVPVGLVGGGALLVGAALVAAKAQRRRRVANRR
jgi:LPXTG-motif cell wall-anchored protein